MNKDKKPSVEIQQEGMCRHGNFLTSVCEICLKEAKENQPAFKIIDALIKESKFKRNNSDTPNCELERGGEKYKIEALERGDHPDLSQVQQLFVDTFGKDEVDPEEILRSAVEGKLPSAEKEDVIYRVYAVKDEKGKVMSVLTGGC